MSKPIIEVTNISKKFTIGRQSADLRQTVRDFFSRSNKFRPEIWALKDINFTVEEGEVLGLIGPNGSGKSTLLKILSRITYPTTGKAVLRGRVSSLLEVGTGFHPELTGRENIFLNGSILGMKKAEIKKKFDEIVDFSGVEQFIDTPVKHYSSGMYVRLAFSVAAHLEPEILLVDEVLSVGDLAFRQKSMGKMNEVAKQGRTVIFVSHDLTSIGTLCNEGIYLEQGMVKATGEILKVINEYKNPKSEEPKTNKLILPDNDYFEFVGISIENSTDNTIACGSELIFSINYSLKKTITDAIFRIEFKNYANQILFVCNNKLTGDLILNLNGSGNIICSIPKIGLNTGNYNIDLYIENKNEIIFSCQEIMHLKIITGSFYQTNIMPGSDRLVLVDHHWEIIQL